MKVTIVTVIIKTKPTQGEGHTVNTNFVTPVLPVRMLWNAVSTLVESKAEVSIKLKLFFSAKAFASSVGTALK